MLKVIGAGFGRTGTYSLKLALETLSFSPCYHMFDLIERPEDYCTWKNFDEADGFSKHFVDGYQAIVDFPGCLHLETLITRYPDAKVILSHRPAEEWYASARKTIISPYQAIEYMATRGFRIPFSRRERDRMRMFIYMRECIHRGIYQGKQHTKAHALQGYQQHIDYVQSIVPKGRLLNYEIREGWAPLCDFLGCDLPSQAFPTSNARGQYKGLLKSFYK